MAENKTLYKTKQGALVGGVCAGFAEVYDWDVTMVRIVYALILVFGVGSPVLLYLLLYIILPDKENVIRTINKDSLSDDFNINEDDYKY